MADDREARKVLLAQAAAIDLTVDGRWSTDTLAEKVQEAMADRSEAEAQAIRGASDTSVFLLRDAFPVEDEKHLAGETIMVPAATARIWFKAGVARPGNI